MALRRSGKLASKHRKPGPNRGRIFLRLGGTVTALVAVLSLQQTPAKQPAKTQPLDGAFASASQGLPEEKRLHMQLQSRIPVPTASPAPKAKKPSPSAKASKRPNAPRPGRTYPSHTVVTTVFWIGESASGDNAGISNVPSAWDYDTIQTFGGEDDPQDPVANPRHNTFYFALPLEEFANGGRFAGCYWQNSGLSGDQSLYKGRWIAVTAGGRTAYAQWNDIGPSDTDESGAVHDPDYVCGTASPQYDVGLDVSPALARYIGLNGRGTATWRFVDSQTVPGGPWKNHPAITNQIRHG